MVNKEAMKLALEALNSVAPRHLTPFISSARAALREALAEQPAQQALDKMAENARELGLDYEPSQQEPSELEIWKVRALQAERIVEKFMVQPQQEPVAFLANGTRFKISYDNRQSGGQIHGIPPELGGRWVAFVAADDDCHLKLTSPPQRTWVGLSDEEKRQLFDREDYQGWLDYINAIEAKLKEKNT